MISLPPPVLAANVARLCRDDRRRIIVTGASGWLGMATLELLFNSLGDAAFYERVICFGSKEREISLRGNIPVKLHALADVTTLSTASSIMLHFAFLTKDMAHDIDEAQYVAANQHLSQLVCSSLTPIGVSSVFVASSGAVYAAKRPDADAALRLYGALKRDEEELFSNWAASTGNQAVIARIFNVSGPYISVNKPYALLDFIRRGLDAPPIVVSAPRRVERGYVAIRELMSLVFALLQTGRQSTQFDTGGEPVELETVAREVGSLLGAPVTRAAVTIGAPDSYVGDARTYNQLLASYGIEQIGLRTQIAETIDFLRNAAFDSTSQKTNSATQERQNLVADTGEDV